MTLQTETTTAPAHHGGITTAAPYSQMLERVRYEGAYPTLERADEAVQSVLAALGRQLIGDERVDLAARLPVEAALVLTAQVPAVTPLTGWEFIKDLAQHTGSTPAIARWNVGAVLAAVSQLAGPELIDRIINQLPSGYALLFGQAKLHQPRSRTTSF
ncbi:MULTISPECIES: DUF2267 domain-containing protein [unclassified Streptomyces]|uniref:DUF2267 domain-containing protein n=1 Tax=unclassified Streptomyces TaxID=2593676 RepID=UPI0035E2BCF2